MYLAVSIISAIFFLLLIGSFIRPIADQTLPTMLVSTVSKSLWLSWFIFLIAFYTKSSFTAPLFAFLGTIAFVYCLHLGKIGRRSHLKWRGDTRLLCLSSALMVLVLLYVLKLSAFEYQLVFTKYDAVVSWNRWAIELSEGVYRPYNAAYPILFPGLWSLIYQAQGDSVNWLVTKASTLVILLVLIFYVCFRVIEENSSSAWLVFGSVAFIFLKKIDQFASGYMDAILAALILLGFLVYIEVLKQIQYEKRLTNETRNQLWVSVFCISVAGISKQAGFVALVILAGSLTFLWFRKNVNTREYGALLVVLLLPFLTFFNLFFNTGLEAIGNYSHLQNLSEGDARGVNQLEYAYGVLLEDIPQVLILVLLLIASLNITNLKERVGVFGGLCLATSLVGFYIFADCCSYSQRNGLWVFSFLILSAACALSRYTDIYSRNVEPVKFPVFNIRYLLCATILMPVIVLAILFPKKEDVEEISNLAKLQILNPRVNSAIFENLSKISPTGTFLTTYPFVHWLPGLRGNMEVCKGNAASTNCLDTVLEQHPDTLILKRRFDFKDANTTLLKSYRLETIGMWELFYVPSSNEFKKELAVQKMIDLSDMTGVWPERFKNIRKGQCYLDFSKESIKQLDREVCLPTNANTDGWLVLGNGYAAETYSSLDTAFPNIFWSQATSINCIFKVNVESIANENCREFSKVIKQELLKKQLKGVVLANNWNNYPIEEFEALSNYLGELDIKTIVIGPRLVFKENVTNIIKHSLSIPEAEQKAFSLLKNYGFIKARSGGIMAAMSDRQFYIDMHQMQCADFKSCSLLSDEGRILYANNSQFSAPGMRKISQQLKEYRWKDKSLAEYLSD